MKMFFVRYWGEIGWCSGQQSGLYVVRAANPEDCAQFIFRWWENLVYTSTTPDMLNRIREKVAEAKSVKLLGRFSSEEMVDHSKCHADD